MKFIKIKLDKSCYHYSDENNDINYRIFNAEHINFITPLENNKCLIDVKDYCFICTHSTSQIMEMIESSR